MSQNQSFVRTMSLTLLVDANRPTREVTSVFVSRGQPTFVEHRYRVLDTSSSVLDPVGRTEQRSTKYQLLRLESLHFLRSSKEQYQLWRLNDVAAFCTCCGAEITLKVGACRE